jgi:endonuclease/exonuclease/phosphatase (EEP) superfamily protein YafD
LPHFRSFIFFLFLAILGGAFLLFLNANRNYQRPPPSSASWSPPDKPVRVVSFNVRHSQQGNRAVSKELSQLNADLILLQEVEKSDLSLLSESFSSVPAIYHASENLAGARASWGNAILSSYPLYDAGTIPSAGNGSFGVWATAVVADRKFKIASVNLAEGESGAREMADLLQRLRGVASPMIIGGEFDRASAGKTLRELAGNWRDTMGDLGTSSPSSISSNKLSLILISPEWKSIDHALPQSVTSQRHLIWATLGK